MYIKVFNGDIVVWRHNGALSLHVDDRRHSGVIAMAWRRDAEKQIMGPASVQELLALKT
jgi:hypothetical protein